MALRLELWHWLFPESPVCLSTLKILDLPGSICMNQFLKINLFLYTCTSYWFCISGECWFLHRVFIYLLIPLIFSTQFLQQTFSESATWTSHCTRLDDKVEKILSLFSPPLPLVLHLWNYKILEILDQFLQNFKYRASDRPKSKCPSMLVKWTLFRPAIVLCTPYWV